VELHAVSTPLGLVLIDSKKIKMLYFSITVVKSPDKTDEVYKKSILP
jgi:hypothetical protein